MESRLVALALALPLFVGSAQALGTVVTLYNAVNGPSNTTATSVQVTPSPVSGKYPGCTDLPSGFSPLSGVFDWLNTAGTDNCSFFVFYKNEHCFSSDTEAAVRAAATATTINSLADSKWTANAVSAKSVGCAYASNPCVSQPCSDPNALCSTKEIDVYLKSTNESFSQYVSRDCSTCRSDYTAKINGICTNLCATKSCPAPAACTKNSTTAWCTCPLTGATTWNEGSQKCEEPDFITRWKNAINGERMKVPVANYTWSTSLAASANATAIVNNQGCPWDVTSPFKNPDGIDQNGYFDTETNKPSDAVAVWMGKGGPTGRIKSTTFTQFGCAIAPCRVTGGMFICKFSK